MENNSNSTTTGSKSSKDYKIIAILCAVAIAFGLYIYFEPPNDNVFNINYLVWIIAPLACGIMSLIIGKRCWHYEVFGKAYLSLGLGFLFYTLGVIIWEYFMIKEGTIAYPGLDDVAYLIYEPLVIMHLVINIRQFKHNIEPRIKVGVAAIAVVITAIFLIIVFTYNEGIVVSFSDFGFDTSLTYVITAAIIFSLAILGMTIFQNSSLGKTWRLLVVGIFIFTVAEVWYDYLSMYSLYTTSHPINALYILSFMIISYALYLHRKAI